MNRRGGERRQRALETSRVLYWIYASRLVVCLGVYGTAVVIGDFWLSGRAAALAPEVRLISLFGLGLAALFTPLSYWHSHRRARTAGNGFLYLQAGLDVALVTGIVHVTGGSHSVFAPLLYIALISAYALVLPLASAVIVAVGTGLIYLLETALAYPELLDFTVLVQIGIFTFVATASGLIAGRLRQVDRELRTVEGELERLQLGTADILRTIEAGVMTLDAGGRVAYANQAAEEMLGLGALDWLGRDLLPELDRRAPAVARAVRETLERGRPLRNREAEISLPGSAARRPAVVHTMLHQRSGAPASVTIVLQDVRLARQLELLRLRAGRLEAVAELSASLVHEIRNPLASIRSAVEQLAADSPAEGDQGMLSRLIVRETDRLSRLLGEFHDFARVDVVQRKPLDLERLIREVIEVVQQRPEAAEGRARFEVRIEERLDDLWGDPDLVHRTLFNLVLNAVQVGGGTPPVTVRIVVDSLRPDLGSPGAAPGAPVRIRVIDDGPGIEREDLERIFDPFYTRRQGGSGMGLAIAHRAVQAHGGALLVSSTPGRGATFAIILPRRDPEERRGFAAADLPEREPEGAGSGVARSGTATEGHGE